MKVSIPKDALLRFYSVAIITVSVTIAIGILAFFIRAEIGPIIVGMSAPESVDVLRTSDSTEIGCGGTTSDPNITLTWDDVEGAIDYCINDNNPNDGNCDYTTTSTSQNISLSVEGTYTFNIAGRDSIPNNGEFASCVVTYDIPEENQPPIIINPPADLSVMEGEAQTFTFSGQDSDGEVVKLCYIVTGTGIVSPATVCLDAAPAGAVATWDFSTSYPIGTYTYTYTVFDDDNAQSTEDVFVLTVTPLLMRPYVDPIPANQTVAPGTVVNQSVSAHDNDGNVVKLCYTITFNAVTDPEQCIDAPTPGPDIIFDLISNLDTSSMVLGEYTYHYYVVDDNDLRSDADVATDGLQDYTFVLTIETVDEIPVVTEPADMTIVVGTDSEFSMTGTDDNQIVNFCYTLDSDPEVCLPATGTVSTFTWVFQTETLPIGVHTYVYYVTDNAGQHSITHTFIITVNPENQKPYVQPIPPNQTVTRGDLVDLTVSGHDETSVEQLCYTRTFESTTTPLTCIDANPAGPTVSFDMIENLDTTLMPVGTYTYKYYVVDNTDLRSDSDNAAVGDQDYTFVLTIEPIPEGEIPYISPLAPDITVNEGQSFTTTFYGKDNDSPLYQLCMQLEGQPLTLHCTDAGTNTGTYAYTWQFNDIADTSIINEGVYTYEYYITDLDGNRSDANLVTLGEQNYSFDLTINNVRPRVSLASNQTIMVGQSATFTGSFNDPSFLSHSLYYGGGANDPDDGPWFVYINYGDGSDAYYSTSNVGSLSIPSHTYNSAGSYHVYLYVTEDSSAPGEGTFGSASVTITVNSIVPNDSLPQAYIIADPGTTVFVGDIITFIASVVNGNAPFSYSWSGDCSGTSSATYVSTDISGIYTCILTVTDVDGDQSTASVAYVFEDEGDDSNYDNYYYNYGDNSGDTNSTNEENNSGTGSAPASYPGVGSASSDNILGTLTCAQKSNVSGSVFYDKNENGTIDNDELGIFDVKIKFYLMDGSNENLVKVTKTDEEGKFELSLCPGNYKAQIVKEDLPENDKLIGEDTKVIQIKIGENFTDLNFQVKSDSGGFNWLWCIIPIVILIILGIIAAIIAAGREDPEEYYSRNVEQY